MFDVGHPQVVTILATPQSNLGALRSTTVPLLKEVLEPLCSTLLNSLAPGREYPDEDYSAQVDYT